jgi:hypothetical protein
MKDRIIKFLGWVCFISLIFQVVNGLWPNISMFLFKGKVIFPNIVFKFSFLISILIISYFRREYINSFFKIYLVFILFLIFETAFFKFYLNYDIKTIIFGLSSNYFWFLMLPLAPSLSNLLSSKRCLKFITGLLIVIAIIGILQYITNSSIVFSRSIDKYYELLSPNFYNRLRVSSLFSFAFDFSFFIMYFFLLYINETKNLFLKLILILSLVFFGYITFLRTSYLFYISVLFNYLTFNLFKRSLKLLPVLNFIIGVVLIMFLGYISSRNVINEKSILEYKSIVDLNRKKISEMLNIRNFDKIKIKEKSEDLSNELFLKLFSYKIKDIPVSSSDSFLMRLYQWKNYFLILKENLFILFFGTGLYGSRYLSGLEGYAIDNFYVHVLVYNGIIGLLIIMVILYKVWNFIFTEALYLKNNFLKPFLIIFPTFFLVSFFDEQFLPVYLTYIILSYFLNNAKNEIA